MRSAVDHVDLKVRLDRETHELLKKHADAGDRPIGRQVSHMIKQWDGLNAKLAQYAAIPQAAKAVAQHEADLTPGKTEKSKAPRPPAFCYGCVLTNENGIEDYVLYRIDEFPGGGSAPVQYVIEGWQHEDPDDDLSHLVPARLAPDKFGPHPNCWSLEGMTQGRRFDSEQDLFDFAVECRRKDVTPRPVVQYSKKDATPHVW